MRTSSPLKQPSPSCDTNDTPILPRDITDPTVDIMPGTNSQRKCSGDGTKDGPKLEPELSFEDEPPEKGLSSMEALEILRSELTKELAECRAMSNGWRGFVRVASDSFSHHSITSTFRWPSILISIICITNLLVRYLECWQICFLVQCLIVLVALIFNMVLVAMNAKYQRDELYDKTEYLLGRMKTLQSTANPADIAAWTSGKFFPQLYLPHSPCINLQFTYRDYRLVNLPSVLLVKGDVIKLCPGSCAPGKIRSLDQTKEMTMGELFIPVSEQVTSEFTGCRLRKRVRPGKFVMMETPFVAELRMFFKLSGKRPCPLYEKERHDVINNYMEYLVIPCIIILVLGSTLTHYNQLLDEASFSIKDITTIMYRICLVIFPLVPFVLPIIWLLCNAVGNIRLHRLAQNRDESNNLMEASIGRFEKQQRTNRKDVYFEDIDTDVASDLNEGASMMTMTWSELYTNIKGLMFNQTGYLWRSGNLLQSLGSITALCCIDKKGILSWPNPTADKAFFLTSPSACKDSLFSDQISALNSKNNSQCPSEEEEGAKNITNSEKLKRRNRRAKYQSRPEVLDVTHDPHSAFSIQFDDPNFSRFLPNLKPLGLAILLNTCNPEAHKEYTRFCDHISCESHHNEAAVPVVNKRCLCELSRQIGFTESAVKDYDYQFQLAMFRHVRHEVIQHGKLLNSLNIPRLKMPFPHVASALIKEKVSNTYQLFSQGTGDLILDACSEFWDGTDLRVLTDTDRKRILDFYHRSSLTAYCMAFSYVPLTICPDKKVLLHNYLELAPDSSHVFATTTTIDTGFPRWNEVIDGRQSSQSRLSGHYLSNESLVMKPDITLVRAKSPLKETTDADSMAAQMNNEVFVGMVTMQYQACPDFVQLVEQMEKACIRFVHFSKENELRSRVFSEKMGLEAGWNCHISLLSSAGHDSTSGRSQQSCVPLSGIRASKISLDDASSQIPPQTTILRSQSAPCAVNLEANMVKFDINPNGIKSSPSSSSSSSSSRSSIRSSLGEKEILLSSPSPSRITDSTCTESRAHQPATITFDALNRAKLPKGIENIRPHLDSVDNVPLLVSLFTDCTPETTCEMITIMQEYGEVVCVLGSSANLFNVPTFLQADISIGMFPLYPEVCVTQPVIEGDVLTTTQLSMDFLSPTNLSRQLVSLPCSLSLLREEPLTLHRLIMESRHFMTCLRNSLQFLLCSSLSLSLVQLFAGLFFLPPLLTSGQVIWMVFVILPALSLSLMRTPVDPHVMTIATGKNLNLSRESVIYFMICYLFRFSPSMFLAIGTFAWKLHHFCHGLRAGSDASSSSSSSSCWVMYYQTQKSPEVQYRLLISQTYVAFFLVLYFVAISLGFVHRSQLFWQKSPLKNKYWVTTSITLILLHLIFCLIELQLYVPEGKRQDETLSIPLLLVSFIWPIVMVFLNTLIKRKEIKANNRQQRRARLEFNTKLGMNSPF